MRTSKLCWIPIIGIYFAMVEGGWLILHDLWIRYQLMCLICFMIFAFGRLI